MSQTTPPNRCRVVLIAPPDTGPAFEARLAAALQGGDVASVILPDPGGGGAEFQRWAERLVPLVQTAGAAAILAGDTRVADRVGGDGVHVEGGGADALADVIERLQGRMAVGAGGIKTRDEALDRGELRPDYVFFGRFGYDTKPEPHSRNLALGAWWAEMIEIPCIVMAGSDLASVEAVAATGADFVALSSAVFGDGVDPRQAVERANALLDARAPRWGEPPA